jgi:peroxiredoxin
LNQTYRDRGVRALVIDVMETPEVAKGWAERWKFSFPVLLDPDGKATSLWAPPDAVPDLPRDQVPIASNLIIDRDGKIRFYSLLDSANFDAKLVALQARLDELLAEEP